MHLLRPVPQDTPGGAGKHCLGGGHLDYPANMMFIKPFDKQNIMEEQMNIKQCHESLHVKSK